MEMYFYSNSQIIMLYFVIIILYGKTIIYLYIYKI